MPILSSPGVTYGIEISKEGATLQVCNVSSNATGKMMDSCVVKVASHASAIFFCLSRLLCRVFLKATGI